MPAPSLLYTSASEHLSVWQVRRIGIMHAQARPELASLLAGMVDYQLLQHFREYMLELERNGFVTSTELKGKFDLILINPSKNRQQTLGWIAEALEHVHPEGRIMLCAANLHGAKGLESRIGEITQELASFSKSKCRCISFRAASVCCPELVEKWRQQAAARMVPGLGLRSQPGLFSWDAPDTGSELLLQSIPTNLGGTGMDLCCGNGFLAQAIAKSASGVVHLHLVDHDSLALACAASNLAEFTLPCSCHWLDAANEALPQSMDWVVCNPPFHQQHQQSIELGQSIVQRACAALKRGGNIWIVANRKLPYEQVLREQLGKVDILSQQQGYKIIHGVHT